LSYSEAFSGTTKLQLLDDTNIPFANACSLCNEQTLETSSSSTLELPAQLYFCWNYEGDFQQAQDLEKLEIYLSGD